MTDESADTSEREPRSSGTALMWFAIIVVVGYPLSSGPAIWCYEYFSLSGSVVGTALEIIYLPFNWVVEWSGPKGVLNSCIQTWGELWTELAH